MVNVRIGIAALLVVNRTLHLRHTRLDHRIGFGGASALTIGLVPLLLVAEQGRTWGWSSTASMLCYGIGLMGAIVFFLAERSMGAEALLPLRLFTNKTVGVASIASVVLGMGMFGGLACLPLYLQIVKGATPTSAGLMLLPMTLGMMSGSIISGQLISRTGQYRQFPIIGCGLLHRLALRVPLLRSRHRAVADDDPDAVLRSRTRFQHAAADPGRAECRLATRHRRGHLIGDLHPSDRRHAGHRHLLVHPVHRGAQPHPDRLRHHRADPGVPGGAQESAAPTGDPAANTAFIHGLQQAQAGGGGGATDAATIAEEDSTTTERDATLPSLSR